MEDIKELKNKELETVAGGNDADMYQGFSVGDWVAFNPDSKTRHSSSGGSGLGRAYYRIREFNTESAFVIAYLDAYNPNPLGDYDILSGGSSFLSELVHSHAPYGYDD